MINTLLVIMIALLMVFAGWHYPKLLHRLNLIEYFSLSFLMGSGITTYLWYIMARLSLPLNITSMLMSIIITHLIGIAASKFTKFKYLNLPTLKDKKEKWIVGVIVAGLIASFIIGNYNPITSWDSIALYDFRGHMIAIDHNYQFMIENAYFMSYPLLVSMLHAYVYLFGGISAQGLHSIIFMALIGIAFGRMVSWTNYRYGLLTTVLLFTNGELFYHSTIAYTNLAYITYLLAGMLYIISPNKLNKESSNYLLLGSLLIGFSTWTRSSEPFWLIGVILLLWQSIRLKAWRQLLVGIFSMIVIRFSWSTFQSSIYASLNNPTDTPSIFNIATIVKIYKQISTIYWYTYLNVYFPYMGHWLMLIPLFFTSLITKSIRVIQQTFFLVSSACAVIFGILIFSTYYTSWTDIGDSARRMMVFIIPLTIIAATQAIYELRHKKYGK